MPLGQGWPLVVAGVTCGGTHIGHSDAPRTRRQGRDGPQRVCPAVAGSGRWDGRVAVGAGGALRREGCRERHAHPCLYS